jgi:AraC-like DNA-binding protein
VGRLGFGRRAHAALAWARAFAYPWGMILLPLPIFLAMILGFLALRMAFGPRPIPLLAGLLGMLCAQALINALALHYGVEAARFVQPISAMCVPALAWLAWRVDALGHRLAWRDLAHAIGPLSAAALRFENSLLLEMLVPMAYAGYAAALALSVLRIGPDLPRAKMGQGDGTRLIWAGIAGALALSALSDMAIAAVVVLGQSAYVPRLVDMATTAGLLGMGVLAVLAQRMTGIAGEGEAGEGGADVPMAPSEDDHALFARLQELMAQRRLWRDPDVTLSMLARRLHVPAKQVSIAVNRVTGQNIARYVNGHRIAAASASLQNGASVTEAMLDAGFLTKSNFNREFRRITGKTPSEIAATPLSQDV